ncbi:hypothetical protein [Stenotrophomonas geniculata]|uniref:Uncharacterized protein n=1 Tax=Stenotrophomonas maltophilia TaxID=40324 RepID=A0AAI9BY38_STEMA|nr:hypothetical protein [Stenotrophomonas geniculata]EKT4090648.1 hypothetical protein [Stenotrophomonas maltophilia]KRG39374.1 hypothetical protein ARC63_16855 [Stenotrophomonas geniculata ATCC 19374 = JCM 13324]
MTAFNVVITATDALGSVERRSRLHVFDRGQLWAEIDNTAQMTLFGPAGSDLSVQAGRLNLQCGSTGTASRARFESVPAAKDCRALVGFVIPAGTGVRTDNVGLLLRTTSWQVTNDTYAYILGVGRRSATSFGVEFGRGSNAASGSFQQLQFVEVPGITESEVVVWLEVELIGSTLTVRRLDGTVVLTRSDSTHQAAGRVGVNYFRGSQGGPGLFTGFYFESLDPTSEYTDEAGDTYVDQAGIAYQG